MAAQMPDDAMRQSVPPSHQSFSSDDINISTDAYASSLPPLASTIPHQHRSLRARRAPQPSQLPPHFRRHTTMDDDSWLQSMSDIEQGSHPNRKFLHALPTGLIKSTEDEQNYVGRNQQTPESAGAPATQSQLYGGSRFTAINMSSGYRSPTWPTQPHMIGFDGTPSGLISPSILHGYHIPSLDESQRSHPSTPASVGIYQVQAPFQSSNQLPHLNTPPASATSFSKFNGSGNSVKPELTMQTSPHGYFKENSSEIIKKWFNDTEEPIAPPQLYNVPPPQSLAPQGTFNDTTSVAPGQGLHISPSCLHPSGRSDLSSQISYTSGREHATQSGDADGSSRRRLPPASESSAPGSVCFDHQKGAPLVSPSVYGSESYYAASSVQSIRPSRLPSPAQSDNNRSAQNALLIECRRKGMSYREIKRIGGFTEAESTLRGRHRMLTKDKESRVRKPEWTENDVELLRKAVRCFTQGQPRSSKPPWKLVAEYITEHGGSYSFGYATCHNKWKELSSTRRR